MEHADPQTVEDAVARVVVDVPAGTRRAGVTVDVVAPDRTVRGLASWAADVPEHHPVVTSRSPDRTRLAVVVHDVLRVVDLRSGAVTEPGAVVAPDGGASTTVGYEPHATPAISWPDDGAAPEVLFPALVSPARFALEPGWVLELSGGAVLDAGHTGDHTTSPGQLVALHGESADELRDATVRLRVAEAAAAERPERVSYATVRNGVRTVVQEATTTPLAGTTRTHWPPVVTSDGVLLRRGVATTTLPPGDGAGTSTEMQDPWLVHRDGRVTTIPRPLGVLPLCRLPEGGFLLRGADALWLDGLDEPLHVLGLDGHLTPFLHDGQPLQASELLGRVAPELLPAEPPQEPEDARWCFDAARVDEDRGELVVLLTEDGWGTDHPWEEPSGGAVVVLPLGGGEPRIVARDERRRGRLVSIAL